MTWFKKLFKAEEDGARTDYYREGVELLQVGKYHEALTSFRLALRERPGDPATLQQVGITYTRIGMTDEAIKTYRAVLKDAPDTAGAHYGLAFLLLREGREEEAIEHLRIFLAAGLHGPEVERHVQHAQETLAELTGEQVQGGA